MSFAQAQFHPAPWRIRTNVHYHGELIVCDARGKAIVRVFSDWKKLHSPNDTNVALTANHITQLPALVEIAEEYRDFLLSDGDVYCQDVARTLDKIKAVLAACNERTITHE